MRIQTVVALAVIAFVSFSPHSKAAEDDPCSCDQVQRSLVLHLSANHDAGLLIGLNQDFGSFIMEHPNCVWSEPIVEALAALLSHSDDDVRGSAANALGLIGPAAKSAVPALEEALSRADEMVREQWQQSGRPIVFRIPRYSGQDIRAALEHITGKKVPEFQLRMTDDAPRERE